MKLLVPCTDEKADSSLESPNLMLMWEQPSSLWMQMSCFQFIEWVQMQSRHEGHCSVTSAHLKELCWRQSSSHFTPQTPQLWFPLSPKVFWWLLHCWMHQQRQWGEVQRTDIELSHIVQQQSPEAQYQQDQGAGGQLLEEEEVPCPSYHPGRGSGEGGLIQVLLGPNLNWTGRITLTSFSGRDRADCSSWGLRSFSVCNRLLKIFCLSAAASALCCGVLGGCHQGCWGQKTEQASVEGQLCGRLELDSLQWRVEEGRMKDRIKAFLDNPPHPVADG